MRSLSGTLADRPTGDASTHAVGSEPARMTDGGRAGSGRILTLAPAALGGLAVAGWLLLASFHVGDRYKIGHVQGHWMALAQYATEGTLYPPSFDGERFGGTRHMPLPILVNAAAARVTGEYLSSGKAVAIGLLGTLLGLTLLAVRRLECPWPLAVGLTGLIPVTNTGLLVGSVPGGDVLSVVLQISALLVATLALRSDRRGLLMVAAILAGLGVCSKLTGVWASLALLSWLALRKDWTRLAHFGAACATTVFAVLGFVQWYSEGRFLTTFLTLTFAGTGGPVGAVRAPNQLMFFALQDAAAVWIIAPFALLGVFAAGIRGLTPFHHALAWSLLLTLGVFTDMGAGFNQLLDLIVLTVVVIGWFGASLSKERSGPASLAAALVVFVIWGGVTGLRGFVPDLREAVAIARTGELPSKYNPRPLSGVVRPGEVLFSEDPGIPVLLGQKPIILDAFMLRRMAEAHPESVDTLVERIEGQEFDHVAMVVPLDEDDFWWQYYHFGLRIVTALREHYVFIDRVDRYYLYQPRRLQPTHQ